MDPYRGSSAVPCARCREALERGPVGYLCPRGHGLWDPTTEIVGTPLARIGTALPTQLHPGRCPSCRATMEIRRWEGVTLDICDRHGVWVLSDDVDYYVGTADRKAR